MDGMRIKFGVDTKDIRRAAFAVGLGFGMAKIVTDFIDYVAAYAGRSALTKFAVRMAQNGDKFSQAVCQKANIKYEDEEKKTNLK